MENRTEPTDNRKEKQNLNDLILKSNSRRTK